MSIRNVTAVLATILLGLTGSGYCQIKTPTTTLPKPVVKIAPCDFFSSDLFGVRDPFGPGNRTLEICINKCSASPTGIEVVVFYSTSASQLGNPVINPGAAYGHGKAKYVSTVGNIFRYEYVFPHDIDLPGAKNINGIGAEFKILEMPSRDASKNPQTVYYRIGVKNTTSNTILASSAVSSFQMPDPITIAMVGDSYAAGEGAPVMNSNLFSDDPRLWDDGDPGTTTDVPCHRSYLSGQAQAAEKIRRNNLKTGFAVKHVACSGAVIAELAQIQQSTHGTNVPTQFSIIRDWLNKTGYGELDILLMGIGGNDAGFAQIVVDFMINPFGDFHADGDAKRRYTDPSHGEYPWNDLKAGYQQLNNDIWGGGFFSVSTIGKPIIIHGYPSPCKGPEGNPWCGTNQLLNNPIGDCWGPLEGDDRPAEFADMHNIVLANLNNAVQSGATENGWVYVDLASRAGNHGLSNCDQPYFNTFGQSLARQGDFSGMVHPNSNGYHYMFVDPLTTAMQTRVNELRNYWKQFDDASCASNEKARVDAQKQLAIEAAKKKAAAKAARKAYPVLKSYTAYRNRYAKQVQDAASDFRTKIKSGQIQLPSLPALSPDVIRNIDFSDKFHK